MLRFSSTLGALGLTLLASVTASAATKIACVGDSITYGYGLSAGETYPEQLEMLLGSEYEVGNFGVNGATALKAGDNPYWNLAQFTESDDFEPNIVVLMLGTNDSKPGNWDDKEAQFEGDYTDLVQHYRDLGAEVYVSIPPPAYANQGWWQVAEVVPHVHNVAEAMAALVIDVNTAMTGVPEDFGDDVHPNAAGALLLAQTVYEGITGNPAGAGGAGSGGTSAGGSGAGGSTGSGGSTGGSVSASGGTDGAAGTGQGGSTSSTGGSGVGGTSVTASSGGSGGTTDAGVVTPTPTKKKTPSDGGCSVAAAQSANGAGWIGVSALVFALGLSRRERSSSGRLRPQASAT